MRSKLGSGYKKPTYNGREIDILVLEDCRLLWRNIRGDKTKFKPEGYRSFCIQLEPELADQVEEAGYKVKQTKPKDDYEPMLYMEVKVGLSDERRAPKITLYDGVNDIIITEENASTADWCEIETVDVVIRPYVWENPQGSGVTAYLKSMRIQVVPDPLEMTQMPEEEDAPF